MGDTAKNIKNTVAAAATAIGIATAGPTPAPNTDQLADSQQIARERNSPSVGDQRKNPTTSGKP